LLLKRDLAEIEKLFDLLGNFLSFFGFGFLGPVGKADIESRLWCDISRVSGK